MDCRPRVVITPYHKVRHPDHEHAYQLLKDSIFISGLAKFRTSLPAYRPRVVINYMMHYEFEPSFIVDISDYFKTKMEAVTSYRSQLYSDYQKQSEKTNQHPQDDNKKQRNFSPYRHQTGRITS